MASQPVQSPDTFLFGGDFELSFQDRELRRGGRVLKLERIPTELLLLIVEQRGCIVSRQQIVERIWGAEVFLDTDNGINIAIRKIRQVLRDNPEQPRYIQTVTGRGYRFIAPVTRAYRAPKTQEPPTPIVLQVPAGSPGTAKRQRRTWPLLVACGAATCLAIAALLVWPGVRARSQPTQGRIMLAVLPFANLTGDPSQDYLSDGVTEEMITQLGRLDPQRMGVIARTSVMRYKDNRYGLRQIGRELGVQYVLEGSVRRDSNHVRITAQLIQLQDETHLFAREYDRELRDVFALQSNIAQDIAHEIQRTIGGHGRDPMAHATSRSPRSYEAYDLYLRGRYFWNKRSPEGFRQAIQSFQDAIDKDPNYARAYAGLADSYALMSTYGLASPKEIIPKARAAAQQALQIDDSLAEAHNSLALIAETFDWDWQAAENHFRRAIELDPNYATAHQWYAEFLAFEGRFDEALDESERARQLDPLSLIIATDNAAIYFFSRDYDKAIERFRAVFAMDPRFGQEHRIIDPYIEKKQYKDALADIERWRRQADSPWPWICEAEVYGRSGDRAKAQRALAQFQRLNRSWKIDPAPLLARAYTAMGDKERALASLEQAYAAHSNSLTTLKVDPAFDYLRSDPRFQDLLSRIGLADGPP